MYISTNSSMYHISHNKRSITIYMSACIVHMSYIFQKVCNKAGINYKRNVIFQKLPISGKRTHEQSLSTLSNIDCQILCQLFRQMIYFVLWVSKWGFLKQSAILAFHLLFWFSSREISCRKNKYLQSTLEYLT